MGQLIQFPTRIRPRIQPLRINVYRDGNDEPEVSDWLMSDALGWLPVAQYEMVAQALEMGADVRFGPCVVRMSTMEGRRT